jgi:hypothetical protein
MCSPDNCIALHCLACACVYSSEAGFWTEITSIDKPSYSVDFKTTALIGNILYWLLDNSSITEFDLDNHKLGLTENSIRRALLQRGDPPNADRGLAAWFVGRS